MLKNSRKPNRQVERTKSWIFEAVMLLMDEKPYNKINISDIAEKAGIARPTFYYNYNDKDDVIFEYLMSMFNSELMSIMEKTDKDEKHDAIIFLFDAINIKKHQNTIKKILSAVDMEDRLFREIQKFPMSFIEKYKKSLTAEEYLICRYKLCFQMTGCLRVLFDWFINDMPMSVENIVLMLNAMNTPKTIQYRNIPSIVIRLKGE